MNANELRMALERKIVTELLLHVARDGFAAVGVHDGEERVVTVGNATKAIDAVFAVDEATVFFRKGTQEHAVAIVLGNGEDCISDWSYCDGDADGFNRAMESFDAHAVKLS